MKLYLVLYLATMQVLLSRVSSVKENVCLKLRQYTTRFINSHCWYNHDVDLSTDEVIIAHRYPLEVYKVVTEDGYILTTFRIPSNRNSSQPIFLQHGATLDSNCWTLIGKKSLPFLLADIGYDVFIGNTRGTNFSNKHKKYPPNSKKYWQFSLDEIAKYDISAQLDFVSGINPNKIIYVGHSMGGTIGVFHGIVKKEQASELLAGYIFLAPVVYLKKYKLVWVVLFRVAPVIKITADVLGVHAFFQQEIVQKVIFKFCTGLSIQYGVCELITFLVFGFSNEQLQPKDLPKWLASWPRGLSVNSMYHYAQIARSGEVKMYDFGKKKNLEMYGQAKPPFYNLSEISLPVHTFYTAKDPLATPESLQPLQEQLGSQDKSIQLVPPKSSGVKFAHLDFLYARDVETYFYDPFFKLLKEKFSS